MAREEKFDLLISHGQIRLRSKPYVEADHQWGQGNLEQGFLLHEGLIVADPLVEGSFGANVIVRLCDEYTPDEHVQRAVSLPFRVLDAQQVSVSSAAEEFRVRLPLEPRAYTAVYEVCFSEEAYYVFTLLPAASTGPVALREDGWGLLDGQALRSGKF